MVLSLLKNKAIKENFIIKKNVFQLQIPKAKMLSEVTLTMEAEGDPSTFTMNMKVLRPREGEMLRLVKYDLTADAE